MWSGLLKALVGNVLVSNVPEVFPRAQSSSALWEGGKAGVDRAGGMRGGQPGEWGICPAPGTGRQGLVLVSRRTSKWVISCSCPPWVILLRCLLSVGGPHPS